MDWSSYKLTVTKNLKTLIQDQQFVDVTLHCEGKSLKAHKLYLSACSNYFKNILKETNLWQHPILFLSEIPFVDLQKILEFIYCGEIEIPQNRLTSFLKSAQTLKINGLIETLNNSNEEKYSVNVRKKKRRKESTELTKSNPIPSLDRVDDQAIEDTEDSLVEVVVKADPDDFEKVHLEEENIQGQPTPNNPEEDIVGNRGIIIRNDLLEGGFLDSLHLQYFIVMLQPVRCTGREVAVISVSCCVRTDWRSPSTLRDRTNLPNTVSVRTARTSFIFVRSPDIGRSVKPDITPINNYLVYFTVFKIYICISEKTTVARTRQAIYNPRPNKIRRCHLISLSMRCRPTPARPTMPSSVNISTSPRRSYSETPASWTACWSPWTCPSTAWATWPSSWPSWARTPPTPGSRSSASAITSSLCATMIKLGEIAGNDDDDGSESMVVLYQV